MNHHLSEKEDNDLLESLDFLIDDYMKCNLHLIVKYKNLDTEKEYFKKDR